MRVVDQLIGYLSGRGILSNEQLTQLSVLGFGERPNPKLVGVKTDWVDREWDYSDWREYYDRPILEGDDELDAPEELDETDLAIRSSKSTRREHAAARRQHQGHRAAGARRSGQAAPPDHDGPTLGDLLDDLRLVIQHHDRHRDNDLHGLIQVAQRLQPMATSETAPAIVRAAAPADLDRVLVEALANGKPTLESIWTSLYFRCHRHILMEDAPGDEPGGPIARAFRSLLKEARQNGSAIHHPQLRRYEEVGWAMDLERAQGALVLAVGRAYDQRPDVLARAIRATHDRWVYTPLVLLHSARSPRVDVVREVNTVEDLWQNNPPELHRHVPRRYLASPEDSESWGYAMAIDPLRVASFMAWFFEQQEAQKAVTAEALSWEAGRDLMRHVLTCPPEWD